jgi:hypothetical protein
VSLLLAAIAARHRDTGGGGPSYYTFGNFGPRAATSPAQANRAWASYFTCPYTGTISAIYVDYQSAGGGGNTKAFVCANGASVPSTVLGISTSKAVVAGTVKCDGLSVSVVSGDKVWLGAVHGSPGYPSLGIIYSGQLARSDSFSFSSPPSSFPTGVPVESGEALVIWARVDVGGMKTLAHSNGTVYAHYTDTLEKTTIASSVTHETPTVKSEKAAK